MWSSPVERRGPDGSPYSLVLLDTEGIDAYDQVGGCWACSWVLDGAAGDACLWCCGKQRRYSLVLLGTEGVNACRQVGAGHACLRSCGQQLGGLALTVT